MSTPKVSAFIRSYAGDFRWLKYCLKALEKRGQEFYEVVVAVPMSDLLSVMGLTYQHRVICSPSRSSHPMGYIEQQCDKCLADAYCVGDFIMHFDSDCIALDNIKLNDFFVDGRPKLLFRKWEDAGTASVWRGVTSSVLMRDPSFETMASHPFLFHRSTHELFRNHIQSLHRKPFLQYMQGVTEFSEFNALGNFCHLYTPDAYHFVRAGSPQDDFPRPFRQYWSHGEFPEAELEALMPK